MDLLHPRFAFALNYFADESSFVLLRADEFSGFHSINLVVCSHAFEQDGVLSYVLHELQNDAQIVTAAARPRTGKFAFEFVGLELRMKRILGQQFERQLKFGSELRMLAGEAAGGTNERTKAVDGRSSRFMRELCA